MSNKPLKTEVSGSHGLEPTLNPKTLNPDSKSYTLNLKP